MKRKDKVVVYLDERDEWRWTFIRSNGRKLADSGEGYKRKAACLAAMARVTGGADVQLEVKP
jgi:uncharacterized protein YegP (UPF0339 family)